MSSVLQQTLRGLCFDTGWCYAVFWKLKQRPRTVLTWEDAFYGSKIGDISADSSATITMPSFGQQFCGGLADMEDPVALSVAKMSYHVYSVGEGIIGRVAFTKKHQWVFSSNDKGTATDGVPNKKANPRTLPEKYPSGWEQQFAVGIKTIALISVPQGVVQLGSTQVIVEDLKLVGHVKALFGTLQNIPGAFLSDFVSEIQNSTAHAVYPLAVPVPHLPPRDPVLLNVQSPDLARISSLPTNMGVATAGAAAFNTNLGCSGVGRLPVMLASQQILTHAHGLPLPTVPGFQDSTSHFQHSLLDKAGFEPRSGLEPMQQSFPFFRPSCNWAGSIEKIIFPSQPGFANPSCITASANPQPRTGITRHLSLSSKGSSITSPVAKVTPSQVGHSSFSGDSSFNGGEGVSAPILESSKHLRAYGRCGPLSRTKSAGHIDGNQVTAELRDIASSIESQKAVNITVKENLLGVSSISGLGNTQGLGNEGYLVNNQQLAGTRPAAEPPCSLQQSLSVGLGRMSADCLQAQSSRHLVKHQQLGNGRSSTESQQLNPPSVEVGQLDWGSHVTGKGPDIAGNPLAEESGKLNCSSLFVERSLLFVNRPPIQSGLCLEKYKHTFLQSRQIEGASTAMEKIQSVSERSSVESSQPRDNISPISMLCGGCMERSPSSTIKQESCMSAETSPLQCEQSRQTSATDNCQMSDLLQLAKEFENADRDDHKDLSCDKLDLHQSISSSLLCDDYFENLPCLKPLFQTLEPNARDSESAENSIENLFTNELDDFDEFFSWLTKAETNKSEVTLPEPGLVASKTDNIVSASFNTQNYGVITKGEEHLGKFTSGSNALPCQFANAQAECERTLHTLDAHEPFSNCFATEVTLPCKELPIIQSELQFDRFVNSRIHPKVSFPCFRSTGGDTELGCQEMAALPPAIRPPKTSKKWKKRSWPDEHDSLQSKDRQKIQDCVRELRAIIPDGASCSIDALLDKAVEYMNYLQSQDSGRCTQSSALQSHEGGNDVGTCSEATSLNASWVMDLGTQGSFCPVVVESLGQPGHMLIEVMCEERGMFLEAAHTLRRLGLTILKEIMEARNNQIWARFVTEGPRTRRYLKKGTLNLL